MISNWDWHHYYTVTRDHTSSSSYNKHTYWCVNYRSILMCCLLTCTHTHTHTHIYRRSHSSHPGAKKLVNAAPRLFINDSLNTESLHCIFQQREDKIAVFEVTLNSLIVKRDAHTLLSLSLYIWEKGLAISNYWGTSPSMSMVVIALIRHENMFGTIVQSVMIWR